MPMMMHIHNNGTQPNHRLHYIMSSLTKKQRGANGSQGIVHLKASVQETKVADCSKGISKCHRSHRETMQTKSTITLLEGKQIITSNISFCCLRFLGQTINH